MAAIRADKRRIEHEPRPEVHQRLLDLHPAWIRQEVELAKAFALIVESRHYAEEDCASLKEYARKFHYDGVRAVKLARIGQAMTLEPGLEEELVAGRIPLESAAHLGHALSSASIRGQADWLDLARRSSPGGLAESITRAIEAEARGTKELRVLRLHVTEGDRSNFRRARYLLASKHGWKLTEGQAFSEVVDDFLEHHDPLRCSKRILEKRRAEDPAKRRQRLEGVEETLRKRHRHIPAEVAHEIVVRSEGRCEVPGCTNEGPVQTMHLVVPYADGGDHHPRNLALGCTMHHTLHDAGRLRCIGFSEDERPIFLDSKERLLSPDPRTPSRDEAPDTS